MKTIRYILVAILCAVLFTACDSREDWWVEHDEKPTFTLDPGVIDTSKYEMLQGRKYYEFDLLCGTEKRIRLNNITQSYDKDFSMRLGMVMPADGYYFIDYEAEKIRDMDNVFKKEYMEIYFDNSTDEIVIKNKVNTEEMQRKVNEYRKSYFESEGSSFAYDYNYFPLKVNLILSNCVGVEFEANFRLFVHPNKSPDVKIEISKIGEKERLIRVQAEDPENHGIQAYEYCIDGDIPKSRMPAYEYLKYIASDLSQYEMTQPSRYANGAHSKEMVYIPSTQLNSIKHAFQTSGWHIIWARAKDNLGYWSSWVSEEIYVE